MKPFLIQLSKYYHTIKYLKWMQIYGRISYRLKKPRINLSQAPHQREKKTSFVSPIKKQSHLVDDQRIMILNQIMDIRSPDIWSNLKWDKLCLYNLHYFDALHANNVNEKKEQLHHLLKRWINENPPFLGNGWEPYTISLRLVNSIKWALNGNFFDDDVIHSLAIQTRFLIQRLEYHVLGNHLLANAKALLFAGLFFDGKEADTWYKKGFKLFNQELREQILKDGGHFELSPMYHAIILEDLLDVINLFHVYNKFIPFHWHKICEKMFMWLSSLCHDDEHISFFNDAALGVAPTLNQLKIYYESLFNKSIFVSDKKWIYHPNSGYCRVTSDRFILITDIAHVGASYQPGHAHADTLSFELSIDAQRVLINSGTSIYAEGAERIRQRSTPSHNTLSINDDNSSEVWKSFRVARRAKVKNIMIVPASDHFFIKASHNGYYRKHRVIHTRTWNLMKDELQINDEVSGKGDHKIDIYFHFHPDVQLEKNDEHSVILYNASKKIFAKMVTDHPLFIYDTTYHSHFYMAVPNKKIIISTIKSAPCHFNTSIKLFG